MLMLQAQGKSASISEAQVYDVRGKPWPTLGQPGGFGGDDSITVSVPGKPEAPLSLAIVLNGGGASVEVPILVEKIAVRDN